MLTIDTLKEYGANTEEGLSRCYGMEEFYLKLVRMIPQETGFARLAEAAAAQDPKAAFEAAHALKGVLSNLSLTPLIEPVSAITEYYRAITKGQTPAGDPQALLAEIQLQYEKLVSLVGK